MHAKYNQCLILQKLNHYKKQKNYHKRTNSRSLSTIIFYKWYQMNLPMIFDISILIENFYFV